MAFAEEAMLEEEEIWVNGVANVVGDTVELAAGVAAAADTLEGE
jgi:hypothetical protein